MVHSKALLNNLFYPCHQCNPRLILFWLRLYCFVLLFIKILYFCANFVLLLVVVVLLPDLACNSENEDEEEDENDLLWLRPLAAPRSLSSLRLNKSVI